MLLTEAVNLIKYVLTGRSKFFDEFLTLITNPVAIKAALEHIRNSDGYNKFIVAKGMTVRDVFCEQLRKRLNELDKDSSIPSVEYDAHESESSEDSSSDSSSDSSEAESELPPDNSTRKRKHPQLLSQNSVTNITFQFASPPSVARSQSKPRQSAATSQSIPRATSTAEEINKTRSSFETELENFQHMISSRCNSNKIEMAWNNSSNLQAYYCSKKINFSRERGEGSIDFQTLKRDFISIYPRRLSKIRNAIWNSSTELQQWFVGEQVELGIGLSAVKASDNELIENFKLALGSQQMALARKIWEQNEEFRDILVHHNNHPKAAAELLRQVICSKFFYLHIYSYIKLVTSKKVISNTLVSDGKNALPEEYLKALRQRLTELDAPNCHI